jgi:hypothetical protein
MIIALAGRAGSGKTTCARRLVEKHGAVELSLAEPLKRLAMEVFGFSEAQVFGTQAQKEKVDQCVRVAYTEVEIRKLWPSLTAEQHEIMRAAGGRPVSPREMLIRLGQGCRKWIREDVWLLALLAKIATFDKSQLVVVSDVRFNNEAEALCKAGASVIRLTCPNAATSVDPNAASEASVDQIDQKWLYRDLVIERSPGASKLLEIFESETRKLLPKVSGGTL